MSKLIQAILEGDMVLSKTIFEEKMEQIREKKLYEAKRSIDLSEHRYKRGPGEEASHDTEPPKESKAAWAEYRKEHPRPKDKPETSSGISMFGRLSKSDIEKRKKAGFKKASIALQKGSGTKSTGSKALGLFHDFTKKFTTTSTTQKTKPVTNTTTTSGPGKFKSNWNTFRGRDASDDGRDERKGKVGRGLRKIVGAAGIDTTKSALGIFGDALNQGRGPLS